MRFTINIDTGGTFTDGFFTCGDKVKTSKVLTTPHDLTVCLMNCIEEGARSFGLETAEMLRHTDVVKYSTTVGTNTIIQRSGPKLGLMVTRGHEETLYCGPSDAGGLENFLGPGMILGIGGEIGDDGGEREPVSAAEVLATVKQLVDNGSRGIVVCLKNSYLNPVQERTVKCIINEEYPKHYLGSVPVLIASDISQRPGDAARVSTALLNAYLHREMVRYLYKAQEDLQQRGFTRPLLIVHSSGGVARVAKTTALNTYSSGPVAGLYGNLAISRLYGLPDLISTDMGGTSIDVGLLAGHEVVDDPEPRVGGLPIHTPMRRVWSLGAGGGSIAWISPDGQLEVGPQSAGSVPGPAAFDRGGTEPTVTDADVVLGYIDPTCFLGGRMRLSREMAERSIRQRLQKPLGCTVYEAALAIKRKVESNIARGIRRIVSTQGISSIPGVMLAYGGAAGTHSCEYANELGIGRVITFPFSSVFCAFGASAMNVMHRYQRWILPVNIPDPQLSAEVINKINDIITVLAAQARRDMRGEGFSEDKFQIRSEISFAIQDKYVSVVSPRLYLANPGCLNDMGLKAVEPMARGAALKTEVKAVAVSVQAEAPVQHPQISSFSPAGGDCSQALKGRRPICWDETGYIDTNVYDRSLLRCGNEVVGPAVVEAEDTTYALPRGWVGRIDQFLNMVLTRE